jgi:hypothetical protein
MLVFMGSPVFVKKGVAVRMGELARIIVVVRSIIEPIWAGPSLRTIFINKNIVGYCGYIGLISFVAYRPDKPLADSALAVPPQILRHRAKRYSHCGRRVDNALNDTRMTHRRRNDQI